MTTNYLILGKLSSGKSATGNSILGREAFLLSSSFSISSTNFELKTTEYGEDTINVVDSPGLEVKKCIHYFQSLESVLEQIDYCVHVVLIVVMYGEKFLKADLQLLNSQSHIYGEGFLERGIIVVTKGNEFEETENTTFLDWCTGQSKTSFGQLLTTCERRCVLFNNNDNDGVWQQTQLQILRQLVLDLRTRRDKHIIPRIENIGQHLVSSETEHVPRQERSGAPSLTKRQLEEDIEDTQKVKRIWILLGIFALIYGLASVYFYHYLGALVIVASCVCTYFGWKKLNAKIKHIKTKIEVISKVEKSDFSSEQEDNGNSVEESSFLRENDER